MLVGIAKLPVVLVGSAERKQPFVWVRTFDQRETHSVANNNQNEQDKFVEDYQTIPNVFETHSPKSDGCRVVYIAVAQMVRPNTRNVEEPPNRGDDIKDQWEKPQARSDLTVIRNDAKPERAKSDENYY